MRKRFIITIFKVHRKYNERLNKRDRDRVFNYPSLLNQM